MRYYLDSRFPPTLKSDAYAKGKEALDYDRMMNPDTYSLDNYENAGLAGRKALVAKAESDTLRTATTETLEEMLSMARANAVQYLLSSFAPSVRTAWDSYSSPSLLWVAILERHEVDNNMHDPTTLIAKINELKYSSSLDAHVLFATLTSLVKQCQRGMIPPDLASMTSQHVHDFYWEQFHSIYFCNAFVEESTIWKSLCKMQMQAKNAGKLYSLADLQRTIMEIIQVDLKYHQMLDQHGSADSTTRLQHLAAPAYPSSAPSIPTAFVAHSLTLPSWPMPFVILILENLASTAANLAMLWTAAM
ncbi:hypothetical protein H257_16275 [Aphanomyces astaci]|uniref:Uncharacterized protein n=1 Tax=Aphanomyces astaci TaxID=112090 RepID=W4FL52_APHAT|nr:hypothetical protein H257_16275 [Aphanomyces astaci]ETV67544.1 hypothetical protein H257_16275 [Aphanomyces astaci]|eukprot:XP_009842948.1 hypothetical protein H257_16275 [Aphanomyces astaci]